MSKPLKFKKVYGYQNPETTFEMIQPLPSLVSSLYFEMQKQMEADIIKAIGLPTNTVAVPSPQNTLTLATLRETQRQLEESLYLGTPCQSIDQYDRLTNRGLKLDLITFTWTK